MKRESSRPFVATTTPTTPFPATLAEFLKLADGKGFLRNDGKGVLTWLDAGNGGTVPGSLGEVGDALQLYWLYGDESPNFEMWGPIFSWRDIAPIAVVETTAGDDTLDVETTEGLKVGSTYVIADAAGTLIETIEVSKILTPKRLRTRLSLGRTLNAAAGAKLARTSAEVLDRFAIFSDGDAFYTRVLDALRLQDRGRLILRRSSDGRGTFTLYYRLAGESAWVVARRTEVRSRATGTRDEEYEIATGGDVELRLTFAGANAADRERVEFLLLGTIPRSEAAAWVEQPTNVTPANGAVNVGQTPVLTGSAYRSLYGLEQGGAHFQVARDALFTDIVVNSSNDWLASWVGKTGYSQNWKGAVALAANKFLAVADSVSVRMDQTGAITATGTVTGDLRCVDADAGLAVAAGAAGAIRTSADEGATYTARAAAGGYAGIFQGAAVRGSRVCLVGTGAEIQFAANGVIFSKVPADGAFAGDFTAITGDGAGNVIAVGTGGAIQTSNSDGQGGWTKREAPGGYAGTYRAAVLLPSGYGVAVGDNGALHETSDFGATWRNGTPDPAFAGRFTAVAIASTYAVAVGENGAIQVKTLPAGKWQVRVAGGGATGAFRALALDPNADALALGDAGLAQRTSRLTGATNTYSVPAGSDMLQTNKVYFWRVRYTDALGRPSPFSAGATFATSAVFNYVRQPDNSAPANGDDAVSVVPTLQASAFAMVGAADTHAKSRWQVARDLAFTDIAYDSGETGYLTSHTVPAGTPLVDQRTYFWRVAYKGTANGFSAWSAPTSFKTRARPNKPVITAPAEGATSVAIGPTITTSAFSMPGGGVHDASRYQISTTSSFASIAYDSGWTSTDKLSHTLPAGALAFSTGYFVRAQHRESGGQASAYSAVVAFTTVQMAKVQGVFATTLFTGAGRALGINNSVDLLNRGGFVWTKHRTNQAPAGSGTRFDHFLWDFASQRILNPNRAGGSEPLSNQMEPLANGFRINSSHQDWNLAGAPYVAWSFAEAPRFLDVVTWTGDGTSGRRIPHRLGIQPGMVLVKALDDLTDWVVWHRGITASSPGPNISSGGLFLNSTAQYNRAPDFFGEMADTYFETDNPNTNNNITGRNYVAWIFAHDPSADGLIQCGSYVGDDTDNRLIELGWTPQWVLSRDVSRGGQWYIVDDARGYSNAYDPTLMPSSDLQELTNFDLCNPAPTGFRTGMTGATNAQGVTFIYVAIRRPGA